MARPKKFTDDTLRQYLAMDFSHAEIARMLQVSEPAVTQRVQKLERASVAAQPAVVTAAAASVWDTKAALEENFKGCLELLNGMDVDAVRVRAEIRNHIKLAMEVVQAMYAVQEAQAFQEEVLSILEECEPGTRQRILTKLQQRRTVRSAFTGG